jgi:hypothetical protein
MGAVVIALRLRRAAHARSVRSRALEDLRRELAPQRRVHLRLVAVRHCDVKVGWLVHRALEAGAVRREKVVLDSGALRAARLVLSHDIAHVAAPADAFHAALELVELIVSEHCVNSVCLGVALVQRRQEGEGATATTAATATSLTKPAALAAALAEAATLAAALTAVAAPGSAASAIDTSPVAAAAEAGVTGEAAAAIPAAAAATAVRLARALATAHLPHGERGAGAKKRRQARARGGSRG